MATEFAMNESAAAVETIVVEKNNTTAIANPLKALATAKNFTTPVTINEALSEVDANFGIEKRSLLAIPDSVVEKIKNGETFDPTMLLNPDMLLDNKMATVRADNDRPLGVVGSKYGVVQNAKAFEFIDLITSGEIGGQKPVIETVGILGGGRRIYVTAKMPQDLYVNGDDSAINDYIVFTNSHDGTTPVMALFTPIRVICQNTLNAAIKKATNTIKFRHSSNVESALDWNSKFNRMQIVEMLQRHAEFKQAFIDKMNQLSTERVSERDIRKFCAALYINDAKILKQLDENDYYINSLSEISSRAKDNIEYLRDTIESGIGQNTNRGTKLWLYNGVTSLIQNYTNYRSEESKLKAVYEGAGYNRVERALALIEN